MLRLPYLKPSAEGALRVIPLMLSVGNHDLGVNAFSKHKHVEDNTRPVFKHYFPQNTDKDGKIPALKDRPSIFTHRLGNDVLFLSLDTGYELEMVDQLEFIEDELSKRDYK